MKRPNRYASQSERLLAKAKLPFSLTRQLGKNAELHALIAPFIALPKESYQVICYHQGELTLATEHTTSLGHLRYLSNGLLHTLQSLPEFVTLQAIQVISINNR